MGMTARPAVIVLAAGQGSRFQGAQHKLAQSLGTSSVLGTTLRQALATQLHVVVVTTALLAEVVRGHVASRDIVVLPTTSAATDARGLGWGMGHSIAAGVSAVSGASGWLLLPGDMPMVRPSTLLAVADMLEQSPVSYAQYSGRQGHPVGFAAELYSELVTLTGDEGARRLVARYPSQAVDVDDPGVLIDVDTVADLGRVRAAHAATLPRGASPA
jgi:molybdenum cofactor cytidylyltransferase